MDDKTKLKIMDRCVHELATSNPVAHELKRSTHRKGAVNHDVVLSTAFIAMHQLLGRYAKYYNEEAEKGEKQDGSEHTNEAPAEV